MIENVYHVSFSLTQANEKNSEAAKPYQSRNMTGLVMHDLHGNERNVGCYAITYKLLSIAFLRFAASRHVFPLFVLVQGQLG